MKFIDFLKPYVIKRIPLMLLSFVIAWILHTYLLVAINEGYGSSGSGISNWLNSSYNGWSAFLIWTIIPFIVWYFVLTYIKYGKENVMHKFTKTPGLIVRKLRSSNKLEKQAIIAGAITILIISLIIKINKQAGFTTALLFLLFCLSNSGIKISKWLYFLWGKLKNILSNNTIKVSEEVSHKEAYLYMLGFIPAFLLVGYFSTYVKIILVIILVILIVSMNRKTPLSTGGMNSFTLLLTLGFILLNVTGVFADDGGLAECGGTWEQWIKNCPGKAEALKRSSEMAAAAGATPVAADPVAETDKTTAIADLEDLLGFEVD